MALDITILPFVLAFIAGILVKWVDWLDDEKKSKSPVKYAVAAAYGVLIGYIIGASSFSVLFLAALVAQVFAKKVDTTAHRVGFIISAMAILFFGFPSIDLGLFAFFLLLAFLDDADYIGWLRPLAEYRPFLKAGAFILLITSIWNPVGKWDYFAGIMLFDIGYLLFQVLVRKFSPAASKSAPRNRKKA
jgi:hypothetical protein